MSGETAGKRCEWCGTEFQPQRPTARFCKASHRTAYSKAKAKLTPPTPPGLIALQGGMAPETNRPAPAKPAKLDDYLEHGAPEPEPDEVGPIERATVSELSGRGRLNTSDGAKAVKLARRLDRANLGDTGSNIAAMAKAHDVAMDRALRGADEVGAGDLVDETKAGVDAVLSTIVARAEAAAS